MFLPATREEMKSLGWDRLDVILVSGDAYIDSPFIGVAVIGNLLVRAGYRTGILAQPEVRDGSDISRLGEPRLFWGITAGAIDSMVANYTALRKKRRQDDMTPGGENSRRPDRAAIAYANLVRKYFKNTRPLVLGGVEASLRRVAHYDYWSDSVRRSLLADAKADFLVYGMGERAVLELAGRLDRGEDPRGIRGICFLDRDPPADYLPLPSYEEVCGDKSKFTEMFRLFYDNQDAITARGLVQKQDSRFLVHNPPSAPLSEAEMDDVHGLPFERQAHPFCRGRGEVRTLATIRHSLISHRGCYGECRFCSIAVHQGRTVSSRSSASLVREAESFLGDPDFKGVIQDVGGPSANMYAIECRRKLEKGACRRKHCLYPSPCRHLPVRHGPQRELLRRLRSTPGIRKVFVASGIRYDMVLSDTAEGRAYLEDLVRHHVSGQLKVAPEHSSRPVLEAMGKPGWSVLQEFRKTFDDLNRSAGKKQFLTYYLIAAHPGCDEAAMEDLRRAVTRDLRMNPEQVQVFTPTPSTFSALMYYTGKDPFTGEELYVERDLRKKEKQKMCLFRGGRERQAGKTGKHCLSPRKKQERK